MENAEFLNTINWAAPTWDIFIILLFLVATFIYGVSLGRDRIIVILVSIYMALAVINSAPYINTLEKASADIFSQIFVFKITGFIAIFLVLFFLLSRSALLKTIAHNDEKGSWWQVILFSFLHVGLLTSIVLSFIPDFSRSHLQEITQQIFMSEIGKFVWMVAPILAMTLIGTKKEKEKES